MFVSAEALSELAAVSKAAIHSHQRRGWQQISISDGLTAPDDNDNDDEEEEEVFELPGSCSPLLFEFLFTLCRELHRGGSLAVERSVVGALRGRAAEALLLACRSATTEVGGLRGEKEGAVLQLLFDCRFASEVLCVSEQDGEAMARSAQGLKELQATLTAELDPVDWATYESHLWELVRQNVQRSAVVLGPLGPLHGGMDSGGGSAAAPAAGKTVTRPTQSMVDADLAVRPCPLPP